MGDKKGDQQARAELLGKLLATAGLQPYMLRHGNGREMYFLVLLRLNDADYKALNEAVGAPVPTVKVGKMEMVALPVEKDAQIGVVDAKRYNPDGQQWTAGIAVSRFK